MTQTKLLADVIQERIAQLHLMVSDPEKFRPISSGVPPLDRILFGGFPRDPFYFALIGDSKAGKTTIDLNLALNFCANSDEPTCLYMLEEINRQVADRVIARSTPSVPRSKIFQLQLNEADFEEMGITMNEYKNVKFHVNDQLFNIEDILKDAKDNGFTRIVVDNFQLMQGGQGRDERTKLADQSKRLMHARKEGITTFLVSQGNEKGLSFGSKQVLMDADLVLGIKRIRVDESDKKSEYMKDQRRLFALRSRYSQQDLFCDIFFDGDHSLILAPKEEHPIEAGFIELMDEHQPPEDLHE